MKLGIFVNYFYTSHEASIAHSLSYNMHIPIYTEINGLVTNTSVLLLQLQDYTVLVADGLSVQLKHFKMILLNIL